MTKSSANAWPPSTNPCNAAPAPDSVGIVIPVRDGMKFFKLCFHSILSFTDHPYTITVVDNQSGKEMRDYLFWSLRKNHKIDVVRWTDEFNFAAQVNLGLRRAFLNPNVRYGLILNADTVVEPLWLSTLMETMKLSSRTGAIGPISNKAQPEQEGERVAKIEAVGRLSGFCMLIRREMFEQLNGFDEAYKGGCYEDWDFSMRARAAMWNLVVDRRVHIHHFWRMFRYQEGGAGRAHFKENEARFFARYPHLRSCVVEEKTA